jgi:hypothetical protein
MHHHRHREQRRGEVDDRDRDEHRDQQAGDKNLAAIGAAHRLGFVGWAKAHRRQEEIFPAEQIGIGEEQDDEADPGNEQQRHRDEIDHDGEQRGVDAFGQRAEQRQSCPGRLHRIVRALDLFGDLVDEERADEGRHRRHQEQRAGDDAERRRDRQHPGEDLPERVGAGRGLGPGCAARGHPGKHPVEPDADQHDQDQAEADRLQQHPPERRRKHLGQRLDGSVKHRLLRNRAELSANDCGNKGRASSSTVIAGLVPAISIHMAQPCPMNRDGRDIGERKRRRPWTAMPGHDVERLDEP